LFVNPMHTHGFIGMTREEAWPLIEEPAEHATQDLFVYYHHWRVGDVLMWRPMGCGQIKCFDLSVAAGEWCSSTQDGRDRR
jgi:hypothetical protein